MGNINYKIIVAYHKPFFQIANDVYLPVQVNRQNAKAKLDMQGDDTGDNISYKNNLYCEMTAVYWAWKNIHADFIGLFHYRRYLTLKNKPIRSRMAELKNYWKTRLYTNSLYPGRNYIIDPVIHCNCQEDYVANAKDFSDYLHASEENTWDAMFAKPYWWSNINNEEFFTVIGRDYISKLKTVCNHIQPSFYPFLILALSQNRLHAANMFVMKESLFHQYCEIVFPILDEVVNSLSKENWVLDIYKERATSRFVGYLAELLTDAYVCKLVSDGRRIKYFNVMMYEE